MAPVPALSTGPTSKTVIGTFEQQGNSDIFQVLGEGGSVVAGMNNSGIMYNTIQGYVVPVAPITVSIDISAGQLLGLHTTPVQLVAAPGPGQYIVPLQFGFQMTYKAPTFSATGVDGDIYVGWGTSPSQVTNTGLFQAIPYSGIIDATQSVFATVPSASTTNIALTNILNKPLSLGVLDTFTTGGGSLAVALSYYIVPSAIL